MRLLTLLVGLVAGTTLVAQETVTREDSSPGRLLRRQILMPLSEFTQRNIERTAERTLQENKSTPLVQLQIFPDKEDLNIFYYPLIEPDTHVFPWRRAVYEEFRTRGVRMAELIAINGAAVLRYRLPDGSMDRKLLQESDPLSFTVAGAPCEIVHVALALPPARYRGAVGESPRLVAYVRTEGVLSLHLGEEIAKAVAERLPSRDLETDIRQDLWFLESDFPPAFPFRSADPAPTWDEWRKTLTLHCFGARCSMQGPYK